MAMALTVKNKIGFINGSLTKPSAVSESDPLGFAWCRCNNMVLSWLINSVSKEIAASIIYIDSAADMWMDLHDRFSHLNGPRVFQLQQKMSSLSQENDSVSTYFTSLKGLWDELDHQEPLPCCTCGAVKALQAKHQRQYVYQFLMGLNESFSHIRGQILLLDPLPPMNKVFSLVLQEERQRALSISSGSFNHNTTALLRRLLFLLNLAPTVRQTTRVRIVLPVPIVEFLDILWRSAIGFMDFHQATNSPRARMLLL
jgi:hypothetical protein